MTVQANRFSQTPQESCEMHAGPTHDLRKFFGQSKRKQDLQREHEQASQPRLTPENAARAACNSRAGPRNGIVAVKVGASNAAFQVRIGHPIQAFANEHCSRVLLLYGILQCSGHCCLRSAVVGLITTTSLNSSQKQVQYPEALPVMMGDLKQIRRFSLLLQKTEIKFDLLSAVDELAAQVKLEFDFNREAAVMDRVAENLKVKIRN